MSSTPPPKKRPFNDSEAACRIFVGGLTKDTTADMLKGYFSFYGRVVNAEIMLNAETNKSRGFGFVTFEHPAIIDNVLMTPVHYLDGRQIDPKRFLTQSQRPKVAAETETKKAFLGGLPIDMMEDELKEWFSVYGKVTECYVVMDEKTGRPRGFGFIAFEDESVIDDLVKQQHIEVKSKTVEVKLARLRSTAFLSQARSTGGAPGQRFLTPSSYSYATGNMDPMAKRMRGGYDQSGGAGYNFPSPYGNPNYSRGGFYGNNPGPDDFGGGGGPNYAGGSADAMRPSGSGGDSNDMGSDAMAKMMQQFQGGGGGMPNMNMMMPMLMSNMLFMQQFQTMFQGMMKQQSPKDDSNGQPSSDGLDGMRKMMVQMMMNQQDQKK